MQNGLMIIISLWITHSLSAQTVEQRLQKAYTAFEADSQLRHAISSLYVTDAKTGKVVFEKNAQTGLAPASTQKIITSVTAFELLGKEYRYTTSFTLAKVLHLNQLSLTVSGTGDPTFGSWRFTGGRGGNVFESSAPDFIFSRLYKRLSETKKLERASRLTITVQDNLFGSSSLPDGYIWQDMGNYYGSGTYQLNWKENQFNISFDSKGERQLTTIASIDMDTSGLSFVNEVTSGPPGSGDNAYIYSAPYAKQIYLRGTVPPDSKNFKIAGSTPDPPQLFASELRSYLYQQATPVLPKDFISIYVQRSTDPKMVLAGMPAYGDITTLYTHYSPSLDTIIYWFNKKSINLYGEALIKTFALEKEGVGSTDKGVKIVRDFWKQKGIDEAELNIRDGSGLSPLNRVTTHAQVEILKYAKTKSWFPSFHSALPEYNNMHMKSGTISDVKGFCGYHTSADGREYIFSFLVNNYTGSASSLVRKMYKVLDELK